MMRTRILILFLIATSLSVGWWIHSHYQQTNHIDAINTTHVEDGFDPDVPAASINEDALQRLATAACKCTRSGDGSSTHEDPCWQQYKKATSKFQVSSMATACAPVSTELECIATDEGEKCIVTGYYVNGASDEFENPTVCTVEEAQAIEAAFNRRSFAGVDDMMRRILAGEAIVAGGPAGGCTG